MVAATGSLVDAGLVVRLARMWEWSRTRSESRGHSYLVRDSIHQGAGMSGNENWIIANRALKMESA